MNPIRILAEHHKRILERRFPNYVHSLHERPLDYLLLVEIWENNATILDVSFLSDRVQVVTPPIFGSIDIILYYADPEFTDDTLSEIAEMGIRYDAETTANQATNRDT